MRIKKTPARLIFFLSFLVCCIALAIAMYFELVLGLQPCPLCVFQRIVVIILAVFFLIASIHGPKKNGIRAYSFLFFVICMIGIGIALYQVYLQSLPLSEVPACGPGIGYLFENLPIKDFFMTIFRGSADCAIVDWRFLSLSIAGWSSVFFGVLGLIHFWHMFRYISPNKTNKPN